MVVKSQKNKKKVLPNKVRIIAGLWKGQYIDVIDADNLRPTPNRIRETLFNWLSDVIEGAICVDLFAGSGSLGIEAASRGAEFVTFVDKDFQVVTNLKKQLSKLGAKETEVIQTHAWTYIESVREPVDIFFLDPPFKKEILIPAFNKLSSSKSLKEGSIVYAEAPADWHPEAPAGWTILKSKQTSKVSYHLFSVKNII